MDSQHITNETPEEQSQLSSRIERNETIARTLETKPDTRKSLLDPVIAYGERFLRELDDRNAFNLEGYERIEEDDFFDIDGRVYGEEEALDFLRRRVDEPGLNSASGGHMGYIPGGALYVSALGDYLAAVMNPYAGVFFSSPGAVRMENALINWAGELVGYNRKCGGNLTSGGSIANLIAISTARNTKGIKGRDLHRAVIYTSRQAHHSILKALRVCGLEECVIHELEVDDKLRVIPEKLDAGIAEDRKKGLLPFLIIANAGSTDIGAVDPLDKIADVATKHGIWMHVDAAYGGFFMLTEYGRDKLRGIDRADSVTLDPHKGLFMPYGSGIILVKDVEHMTRSNDYTPSYLQDASAYDEEFSPAELSPELSKHFRGLRMWLPLKIHGLEPFRAALEEKLDLTRYFYHEVQKLGFKVGPDPDLSIAVFRYIPETGDTDAFNKLILKAVYEDGRIFVSSTALHNQFYLRIAILHFRTHKNHIDTFLEVLKNGIEIAKKGSAEMIPDS